MLALSALPSLLKVGRAIAAASPSHLDNRGMQITSCLVLKVVAMMPAIYGHRTRVVMSKKAVGEEP